MFSLLALAAIALVVIGLVLVVLAVVMLLVGRSRPSQSGTASPAVSASSTTTPHGTHTEP